MKKINANILKPSYGDCSNYALSSQFDKAMCYFLENGETIDDIKECEPNAVVYVPRILFGELQPYFEPVKLAEENSNGYMFGGCFIYTSDSRFRRMFNTWQPISLHDRQQ